MPDLTARLVWATDSGLQTYTLKPGEIVTLGREPSNDIVIPLVAVSRSHARIENIGNSFVLSDLGSANGTYVNGNLVGSVPWILRNGNRVQLSDFRMIFHIGELPENIEEILQNWMLSAEVPMARGLVPTAILKDASEPRKDTGPKSIDLEPYLPPFTRLHRLVASTGLDSGRRFDLTEAAMVIGYAGFWTNFDIELNDPSVSQPHAQLERQGDEYILRDLGSKKGTRINGKPVTEPVLLQEGDVIMLGDARLVYRRED